MKAILDWTIRYFVRQYEALEREPAKPFQPAEVAKRPYLHSPSTSAQS